MINRERFWFLVTGFLVLWVWGWCPLGTLSPIIIGTLSEDRCRHSGPLHDHLSLCWRGESLGLPTRVSVGPYRGSAYLQPFVSIKWVRLSQLSWLPHPCIWSLIWALLGLLGLGTPCTPSLLQDNALYKLLWLNNSIFFLFCFVVVFYLFLFFIYYSFVFFTFL